MTDVTSGFRVSPYTVTALESLESAFLGQGLQATQPLHQYQICLTLSSRGKRGCAGVLVQRHRTRLKQLGDPDVSWTSHASMTNLQKLIAWQAINKHAWKDEHIQRYKRASSSVRIIPWYSSNTRLAFEEAHHPHIVNNRSVRFPAIRSATSHREGCLRSCPPFIPEGLCNVNVVCLTSPTVKFGRHFVLLLTARR